MYSIIETFDFQKKVKEIWSEDEKFEFFIYIATYPEAGVVIPGAGGLRKIRWSSSNKGKRAGARVIYYNELQKGYIYLLDIYKKNLQENIKSGKLKTLRRDIKCK